MQRVLIAPERPGDSSQRVDLSGVRLARTLRGESPRECARGASGSSLVLESRLIACHEPRDTKHGVCHELTGGIAKDVCTVLHRVCVVRLAQDRDPVQRSRCFQLHSEAAASPGLVRSSGWSAGCSPQCAERRSSMRLYDLSAASGALLLGHPPKVVWNRRGSCSTAEVVGQPAGLTMIADQGMFIVKGHPQRPRWKKSPSPGSRPPASRSSKGSAGRDARSASRGSESRSRTWCHRPRGAG